MKRAGRRKVAPLLSVLLALMLATAPFLTGFTKGYFGHIDPKGQ